MLSRRTLLKTGLAGAALLGGAGLVALIAGRDRGAERRDLLFALAGALLDGALPTDPAAAAAARTRCVSATGTAIDGLSPAAQDELAQLFTLLSIAPGRLLLAGLDRPWSQAAPSDIRAAVDGWRNHRLPLMQTAYHALHDLLLGAWYGDEANWMALGYGGPVRL